MEFGVSTFVTDEGITPGALGAALEERGFASLFVTEHTNIPVSRETPFPAGGELPRPYHRTFDPIVALTAAAVSTERLRLGTGVALIPQRDPIIFAKEMASLDQVSGGRAVLGIGAGWNREEMRNHGTDPRTRMALMRERVLAIKLDAAAHSRRVHANNDDHSVVDVYELLWLEAPFGPRVSPVLEPAFNANAPPIRALVRGIVVVDLDPLVEHVPGQLSGREEALIEPLH